jgi:transposase, IS5 family
VPEEDPVPSGEELVSLAEPHTQVIPRFEAGMPTGFGRKLRLDEAEGGIIVGYRVQEKGAARTRSTWPMP